MTGQQYLQDLHCYDLWADRWTELPVAGGWPDTRGGHAASWDPNSQSMIIVGHPECERCSELQRFDVHLRPFRGSIEARRLASHSSRPNRGHAIVWDKDQRAHRRLRRFGPKTILYRFRSVGHRALWDPLHLQARNPGENRLCDMKNPA